MPRLDCRYQSISQHAWELCRFPTLLARYSSTALSAIVALTSTPTHTKQPQPADLVPPSTGYYVRTPPIPPQVAGSASGTPNTRIAQRRKQWYRSCTAFCAFLISMPLPAQDLRHHAPPARRFIKRTSLSPNNPHARTRHSARWSFPKCRCRHPDRWQARFHHICALSSSDGRSMQLASSKDAVSLLCCHGSPGQHRSATNSSHRGLCGP